MRSAAALIIGDEILHGEIPDENGPDLVRRFQASGIRVVRVVTVPDEVEAIVTELRHLRALADAVIVSGGIGPTHDDHTRPAIAEALGLGLAPHPGALERIRHYYGKDATEADLDMGRVPVGARLLRGPRTGTFGFEVHGVYALPGVPALFRDLLGDVAQELCGRPLHRIELTTPRREGEIASRLAAFEAGAPGISVGSYPVRDGDGGWRVRVVLRGADPDDLARAARDLAPHLR